MNLMDAVPAHRRGSAWIAVAAVVLLGGCASALHQAPVEQRQPVVKPETGAPVVAAPAVVAPTPTPAATPPAPLPGAENAGKPGYYTVKPGDTMIRIGLEFGQNWRDIARWNELSEPYRIEIGQVLRVAPPATEVAAARPVAAPGAVETRPLDARPASPAASAPPPTAAPAPVAATPPAATRDPDEDIAWAWPASGAVVTPFDDVRSKGLAITGRAGDPVLAAADGRVVYAGSGLRGYGNLVIVKHNATYLTAYAHNQTLLVKEDQVVRRGQKIAEMGSSDADRVQLHFEIRRQGKPVDPARYLPSR